MVDKFEGFLYLIIEVWHSSAMIVLDPVPRHGTNSVKIHAWGSQDSAGLHLMDINVPIRWALTTAGPHKVESVPSLSSSGGGSSQRKWLTVARGSTNICQISRVNLRLGPHTPWIRRTHTHCLAHGGTRVPTELDRKNEWLLGECLARYEESSRRLI